MAERTAALSSPAARDLLMWERSQSLRPAAAGPAAAADERGAEELARAVAAELRKGRGRRAGNRRDGAAAAADGPPEPDGGGPSGAAAPNGDGRSLGSPSEARRRRSLRGVERALGGKGRRTSRGGGGGAPSGGSAFGEGDPEESFLSGRAGATRETWETRDTVKTSGGTASSGEDDAASLSTVSTLRTSDLSEFRRLIAAHRRAESDSDNSLHSLEVDRVIDSMGLGVCALESTLDACCPWLICANHDVEREERTNGIERKGGRRKKGGGSSLAEGKGRTVREEKAADGDGADAPAEWTICGPEPSEDDESRIDWNGNPVDDAGRKSTRVANPFKKKKSESFGGGGGDAGKGSSKSGPAPPVTVKQRLAKAMKKRGVADGDGKMSHASRSSGVFRDTGPYGEEAHEDRQCAAIRKAEEALREMSLLEAHRAEEADVESGTEEDAVESPSDEKDDSPDGGSAASVAVVPPAPSKASSASSFVPGAPEPSVGPSAPSKTDAAEDAVAPRTPVTVERRLARAMKSKRDDTEEKRSSQSNGCEPVEGEGVEQGFDGCDDVAVESKDGSAHEMEQVESKDGSADETEREAADENPVVSTGCEDQPPSVPSTPLTAVIPSAPLPSSARSTPVAAVAVANSSAHLSMKQRLSQAVKLKKDCAPKPSVGEIDDANNDDEEATNDGEALAEEQAASSELVARDPLPPIIPSTPLSVVPSEPLLPNSARSTPVPPSTPPSAQMTMKKRLSKALRRSCGAAAREEEVHADADAIEESAENNESPFNAAAEEKKFARALRKSFGAAAREGETHVDADVIAESADGNGPPPVAAAVEDGIDSSKSVPTSDEFPPVPSTPSKAIIPSTPLPVSAHSTPVATPSHFKQRFTQTMKAKKDRGVEEKDCETNKFEVDVSVEEEGVESSAVAIDVEDCAEEEGVEEALIAVSTCDQPPPIPLTPLKAFIPSTPLPSSAHSTPVAAAATSTHRFSVKQKFVRAIKSKKEVVSEERVSEASPVEVDVNVDEVGVEGGMKAALPSTPLPSSAQSTPVAAAATTTHHFSMKQKLASAIKMKKEAAAEERDSEANSVEVDVDVDEEGVEGGMKAALPSTTLPSSACSTPVAVAATSTHHLSVKQKLARASKSKKEVVAQQRDSETSPVEVDVNVDEDGVEGRVVPASVGDNSEGAAEVQNPRNSPRRRSRAFVPPSPANSERSGEVILASTLLESHSSSRHMDAMRRFARAVKRRGTEKKRSRAADPVNAPVDQATDRSIVPASPDHVAAQSEAATATATEEKVIIPPSDEPSPSMATPAYEAIAPTTALSRITPTASPVQRLVKTMSSLTHGSIGERSEILYVEDSRVDGNEAKDELMRSDVPALPTVGDARSQSQDPIPANNEVKDSSVQVTTETVDPADSAAATHTESNTPSSAFAMMLAQAMSFMTEDGAEQKSSEPSVKKAEEVVNSVVQETVEGEETLYNPRILDDDVQVLCRPKSTEAFDASSAVDSTAEKNDGSNDALNSSTIESDPEINVSHAITREMSIATQRMNNRTAASTDCLANAEDEIPGSIEYTPEMCIVAEEVNTRSSPKLRNQFYARNLRSKSRNVFSKAKSFTKDKLTIKDTGEVSVSTKSTASVPSKCLSAFSCSTSDFTEQAENLTSKRSGSPAKKSSSKSKKPKKWREYTDPNTGNKYYSNGVTTTWTKPPSFVDMNARLDKVAETSTESKAATSMPATSKNSKYLPSSTNDQAEVLAEKVAPESKTSRLSLIRKFKSRMEKEKDCLAEDISICTDTITTDSEGNISVVSSQMNSASPVNSPPSDNSTLLVQSDEALKEAVSDSTALHICTNIMATDCEGNVNPTPATLDLEATNNTVEPEATEENNDAKPKKKKRKKKKGWREYTDPNTGNKYYSNGTITTWDKPAEFDDGRTTEAPETTAPEETGETGKRVTMITFA